MYKPPGNPQMLELQKTHKDRRVNASSIKCPTIDGKKLCAYCAKEPITGHRSRKYCSTACQTLMYAWISPQKEEGLAMLLMRQDWKCAECLYDYAPLMAQLLANGRVYNKPVDFRLEYNYSLIKRIKQNAEKGRKPEVDHVLAISKGGQSIGLENVRCLCYLCHKAKTKIDNSGPRQKKS